MFHLVGLVSTLLRLLIGYGGYSGAGKPPMFGDFEAQRHWMEVTLHLNIGDWYRNTSQNDLLYWGLDYPPLTAYASYIIGWIATFVEPKLVEWETSRGYESESGKLFMRWTVIITDLLIYFPAIIYCASYLHGWKSRKVPALEYLITLGLLLNMPSLLLIDHGHFQYNSVCIGFALLGAYYIQINWDILGSFFFCCSLNFKQMSLYYSPIFFCILLRKCFNQPTWKQCIQKFIMIGGTVILTFACLWFPFCVFHTSPTNPFFQFFSTSQTTTTTAFLHDKTLSGETCLSSLLHVLQRQFPFGRGIFEDKVGNLWYAMSVIIDYRTFLPVHLQIYASLSLTLLLLSPVIVYTLMKPIKSLEEFCISLKIAALSFFLASFQVRFLFSSLSLPLMF
jgi:alpha-1,3-glucosyltransferase